MHKNHIVCLFEFTGESARPFAEAGYEVWCYDIQHPQEGRREAVGKGFINYMYWDATTPWAAADMYYHHRDRTALLLAFPPCTDLAVSGAKHFAAKAAANPQYREQAMAMVYLSRDIGEALGCPYAIENPVSVISSEWRKPDYTFHPWEFGGYIPEEQAEHPRWPEHIAPRDAYPKKTCLWTGGDFTLPVKRPVDVEDGYSRQFKKLGGKSLKTKNIRSATPRGFAKALFEHYHTPAEGKQLDLFAA